MFHYIFTIQFENTSIGTKKTNGGLTFDGTCIAKDDANAIALVNSMAEGVWENVFKNFAPSLCSNGSTRLYPMLNKPSIKVSVSKEEIVCEWGDCHDDNLRRAINEIWANADYRKKLVPIMRAYFERDCDELANFYDQECVWWKANEIPFDGMLELVSFESLCDVMFSHILDDGDYKAIINYIRPKLSFVENWWELT